MIPAIDLFKALSDVTRLKIVMLIQLEGELCVCELMVALSDNQPKISRHLAQLKRMGLLVDRKQKQWVYYRLNPALKGWVQSVINETCNNSMQFVQQNRAELRMMVDRPDGRCR